MVIQSKYTFSILIYDVVLKHCPNKFNPKLSIGQFKMGWLIIYFSVYTSAAYHWSFL